MNQPPFQLGQKVFLATASPNETREVPCPVCFGKKQVTLILGNGEQQPIECNYCALGYEAPRGVVVAYGVSSRVDEYEITGLRLEGYDESWDFDLSGGHRTRLSDGNIFADRASAEARRLVLHAEAERAAELRLEGSLKSKKKGLVWSAGYYRSRIADLNRQLAWHQNKLCAAQEAKPKRRTGGEG